MPLVLTEANSSGRATRGRTCSSGSARWVWRSCCRSEEHTSELQSRRHLVCRLLLEKKKLNRLASPSRHTATDPLGNHRILPVIADCLILFEPRLFAAPPQLLLEELLIPQQYLPPLT